MGGGVEQSHPKHALASSTPAFSLNQTGQPIEVVLGEGVQIE